MNIISIAQYNNYRSYVVLKMRNRKMDSTDTHCITTTEITYIKDIAEQIQKDLWILSEWFSITQSLFVNFLLVMISFERRSWWNMTLTTFYIDVEKIKVRPAATPLKDSKNTESSIHRKRDKCGLAEGIKRKNGVHYILCVDVWIIEKTERISLYQLVGLI